MPVDPASMLGATEWQIPGVEGLDGRTPDVAPDSGGGGFRKMLGDQIGQLEALQTDAAQAAAGSLTAPPPTSARP